ncbi:MAG TPA: DNA repair protein RecN [Polyangiaceae bacterium]|nr:DNA repair protein RecN [Polyangiaceae bacterium]
MLLELSIQNLVLIDRLSVEFAEGFNVLTGETGAGKSMLVDALGLVLGGRASADVVRTGEKETEVEARFELQPGSRALERLAQAGIPCDGELVVRRVVQAEGRSRAFLNGRLSTAAQLAELAKDLCDIASQHESVSLTDPASHLEYLDAFGRLDDARSELRVDYAKLADVVRTLESTRATERSRGEREDFLAFQAREIDELDPSVGEEHALESERARLRHAERLVVATRGAAEGLYDGDEAICDRLGRIVSDLEQAASLDPSLAPVARAVDAALAELSDAARQVSRYAESVEENPERLAELDERYFRLQKLLRKHGPSTQELLAYRQELGRELEAMASGQERVVALEADRDARLAAIGAAARALSKKRRAAAEKLADAVGRELGQLGMGRARVSVDVAPIHPGQSDALVVDGARLTENGVDRVEFLIAPNKGEDPKPLRRIASGGELSRALLALKRVLAEKGPAGLYVFDEVDAGVSGAVAEVIGRSIAEVSRHRQVLCITHLPQIAALADTHFVVDKSEEGERTVSRVRRLSESERVAELARMIGGVKVGDAARKAARELLAAKDG